MTTIIGAGLSGLLAANMLARHKPLLVEAQKTLPNNHHAVLRFRSSVVGDTLGIPFKRVSMIKDSLPWRNPVADSLAYSFKNTGVMTSDRSITSGLTQSDRFIAPPDLVPQMAALLAETPTFGHAWDFTRTDAPVISTLPMPLLMDALDYPGRKAINFHSRPGTHIKASIDDCDAYVSLLVPDPKLLFSRISITGNELIIECQAEEVLHAEEFEIVRLACELLGIAPNRVGGSSSHSARYAKILAIDEELRRDFIYWATDHHQVFSLGRFATWRPKLLMDDLVKDIRLIESWLGRKNRYAAARTR